MHPAGTVELHCAEDAVAEHAFHDVGNCGLPGHAQQMIRQTENRGGDAGFPEGGFWGDLHLLLCAVVPELPPEVFESARTGDEQFVADDIPEIGENGIKRLFFSGVAAEFQESFETGGHFIGFSVAEIGRFFPCAGLAEQMHGIRAAGVGESAGKVGKAPLSGETGGNRDGAEDGVCGHSVMPETVARTFPRGETGDQMGGRSADRFEYERIGFDVPEVPAESEQNIFSSPDIPGGKAFFGRIGGDAAVRLHAVAEFPHTPADHRFQRRIGVDLQDANGGADDFSPELSAPAPVAVLVIAEGTDQFCVIHFFKPVFHREADGVPDPAVERDRAGGKQGETILIHE